MIPKKMSAYRITIFFVVLCFSLISVFAEDDTFVFAASKFVSSKENDATAELIPLYILQNFSDTAKRTLTREEQYRAKIQSMNDEITALYEELQETVLEKDTLVLSQNQNIDYIEDRDELEQSIIQLKKDIQEKNAEKDMVSITNFSEIEKDISMWNKTSALYPIDEEAYYFNPKDIQALITGSIEYVDSFLYVTTYITLYPGKIVTFELEEVDSINEIQSLSKRIAEKLYVSLANKDEITVTFSLETLKENETATIYMNGTSIPYTPQDTPQTSIQLSSGIYEFYVEAEGYEGVNATYSFMGNEHFLVEVQMIEEKNATYAFTVPSSGGEMFLNTKKMTIDSTSETETRGSVLINDLPALGEFVGNDDVSTWFLLDAQEDSVLGNTSNQAAFTIKPNTKNFADIIEKNRKRMYNSYAALIVSLPLYFIANGQYLNEYNSWATGKSSGKNLSSWETARDVTMGASIGLGLNFLVQLGIYIYSANAILPDEVTIE